MFKFIAWNQNLSIGGRRILLLGLIFMLHFSLWSQEKLRRFELPNGIKVAILEKREIPLINVVAGVDVGSKDETDETSGLVHLLEHIILFRGTEQRSGSQVSLEVRRHGAYFNAHTGHDISLFEIVVPSAHGDFALRNQREILFDLEITCAGVEEEKEVILEEFSQMEDDPFKYSTSLIYQNLFQGHPYGNPIHGKREVIESLTADQVKEFYQRYFIPANCTLAVVGDFDGQEMEKKIRDLFGKINGPPPPARTFDKASSMGKGVELEIDMDINKAYLIIGVLAPDYNHPDQYAVDVLTEVLGRNVNPMLLAALRERWRLVETVAMNYYAHRYGGALVIYLSLDPKNLKLAKRQALDFLKKVRTENFSPNDILGEEKIYAYDFLESAKNHIRHSSYLSREKGLNVAGSLAMFMLLKDEKPRNPYLEYIDEIDSTDLRRAGADYLSREDYVILSVLPKRKSSD